MSTSPPPGWYPDPSEPDSWRWWNGRGWSPHRGRRSSALASARAAERGLSRGAEAATLAAQLAATIGVVIVASRQAADRELMHELSVLYAGTTSTTPYATTPYQVLASLVGLAAYSVFLTWQYRAARVAALLGYPRRHTPGWGVGSWFVPFVNLVVPRRALADLFPAAHPLRRTVSLTFFAFVGTVVANGAAIAVCEVGPSLRALVYLGIIALDLAVGAFGLTLVRAVDTVHEASAAEMPSAR